MTTTLICAGIALLAFNIVNAIFIWKNAKDINRLGDIHNNAFDYIVDMYEDLVKQANDRIDMVNWQFHRVDDVLEDSHEIFWDIIDTLEIQLDTNEAMCDRLTELEDDTAYMWDAVEEHDEILYEFFEDEPEEIEEEKPAKKSKKK